MKNLQILLVILAAAQSFALHVFDLTTNVTSANEIDANGLNEFDIIYSFRAGSRYAERYRVSKKINNDYSSFVDDAGVIINDAQSLTVEQSGNRNTRIWTGTSPVRYRGGSAWKMTASSRDLSEMYVFGSGSYLVIDVILDGAHPHVLFQCTSDSRFTNCRGLDNSIFGYMDRVNGYFYVKEGFIPSFVVPALYNYILAYKA